MSKKSIGSATKVIKNLLLVVFLLSFSIVSSQADFKNSQTKYKKVKTAYDKKWESLKATLVSKGVDASNFEVQICCFKQEKELQVWCRSFGTKKYTFIKTIPICASSGELGPKRKEGDLQVPEGMYEVSWFNPMSDYHLGLKINYPNSSDKIKAKGNRPGGDIMIHGNCVTIGCIPLQNEPIEEVYVLCVESKNRQHKINVSIFPFQMNDKNWNSYKQNKLSEELLQFWSNLKQAYTYFETNREMPTYKISKFGEYEFKTQ
jgi:murein L,D-transpeptidase YafK